MFNALWAVWRGAVFNKRTIFLARAMESMRRVLMNRILPQERRFVAAIFFLLPLLAAVGCAPGTYKTDADRAYDDAVHNRKMVEAQSDAVADLWDHCTYAPPTQPANQKRCKAILARVQKDIAADDARIEAQKRNW